MSQVLKCGRGNRASGEASAPFATLSLPDPQEQLARLPQQLAKASTFRKGLARIIAMLERVLVAAQGAWSRRTPMHAATLLAADGWWPAGAAWASLGAAAGARKLNGFELRTDSRPSFAPLGYRNLDGPGGKKIIAPDPDVAPIISKLFDWYATGRLSLKEAAHKARDAGLVYRKSGTKVPVSTVHSILRNRIYTGWFEWNGKMIEGRHEPLVSVELLF